ncbi:hypothetical protein UT300003_08190 [Clostridium sardiniense]|uniref:hypothetical protein n=1 Tax=Clostridium sardiniense TaxID=29369 RepID=UPI001959CE82|nr:hypothetical protein [Clostridium sardiniense]MBM7836198.1 hypothetical protein [Clostridium sardiniense]
MKNIIKKSLIYQWFYTTKWAIILATFIWTSYSYLNICNHKIIDFKSRIALFNSDKFILIDLLSIAVFICLIILVYIAGNGLKKRSKMIVISSGPYTRNEIFWNNFLCNIGIVVLFIIIYIYLTICIRYKQSDVLYYCSNYYEVLFKDSFKLLVLGILTIAYSLLIDRLFSNSFVTIISIVLIPVSLITFTIINIEIIFNTNLVSNNIYTYIIRIKDIFLSYLNYFQYEVQNDSYLYYLADNNKITIFISFLILLISFGILFIVKLLNKKVRIESISNFFVFKNVKYIITFFASIAIGAYGSYIIHEIFMHNYFYNKKYISSFIFIEIIFILISNIIINRIISKFIK